MHTKILFTNTMYWNFNTAYLSAQVKYVGHDHNYASTCNAITDAAEIKCDMEVT